MCQPIQESCQPVRETVNFFRKVSTNSVLTFLKYVNLNQEKTMGTRWMRQGKEVEENFGEYIDAMFDYIA